MAFGKAISKFTGCERGVVAIIYAITMIPVMMIVGAAIDYSHVSSSKTAIQEHLDSAILAGTVYKTSDPQEKIEFARKHFYAVMPEGLKSYVRSLNIELTAGEEGLHGTIDAIVPTQFLYVLGIGDMHATLVSEADTKVRNRQLDMAFCIDATGSMQEEIDGVMNAAYDLEKQINQKLKDKDKEPFDAMRVRVIFYRDFGSDRGQLDKPAPPISQTDYNDPNWEDFIAPMNRSNYGRFWTLPDQRSSFKNFIDAENANGGEDEPESGFICLNEALESEWAQEGVSKLASNPNKTVSSVTPLIAIWTDANARPIVDTRAQHLPQPQPRSYQELQAKWDDPKRFNQKNKLLVFFGDMDRACPTHEENPNPVVVVSSSSSEDTETDSGDTTASLGPSPACPSGGTARWRESIGQWGMGENVFNYSLQSATTDLASQIADALTKQPNALRLTQ